MRAYITGGPGAGVTTLGSALSANLKCQHIDVDDYYWIPTFPPYQEKRDKNQCCDMIRREVCDVEQWVLSGSIDGWGNELISLSNTVIFVFTPTQERLRRLMLRESEKFGDAIKLGGDMHSHHKDFISWAESYDHGNRIGRNLLRHEVWLRNLDRPYHKIDGLMPVDLQVKSIISGDSLVSNDISRLSHLALSSQNTL